MHKVLVLNGPNLNLLGRREPDIYGDQSLEEIVSNLLARSESLGLELEARQSNSEGELIDWVHDAQNAFDAVIINPGGLGHTSVALRDALAYLTLPVFEVHISNIFAREEFRRHSLISEVATGVVTGFGTHGYLVALEASKRVLSSR